jgi:hypothetical protein
MMGTGGTLTGDPAPGTKATVQKRTPGQIDRDWRYIGTVLPVQILNFTATSRQIQVMLNWTIITPVAIDKMEIERSIDNSSYHLRGIVTDTVTLNKEQHFSFADDISTLTTTGIIFYRLKFTGINGEIKYSNVVVVKNNRAGTAVTIMPNPAKDDIAIRFFSEKAAAVTVRLVNSEGKTVLLKNVNAVKGYNSILLSSLTNYSIGVFILQVLVNDEVVRQKLILSK